MIRHMKGPVPHPHPSERVLSSQSYLRIRPFYNREDKSEAECSYEEVVRHCE